MSSAKQALYRVLCPCVQDYIEGIRKMYEEDWYAAHMQDRQMGVALYFIDKLALRAGHEKDEDEADTVGCCTLKVCAADRAQCLLSDNQYKHFGGHIECRALT